MRFIFVAVLAGLCALALAETEQQKGTYADKVFLEKQKNILRLFKYVNQKSYYKDHIEIAQTYDIEKNIEFYTKPEYVKEFFYFYKYNNFPRGEIFSVFNDDHLKYAQALFKVFYYAKDFETFYKTAVWARNNVNEGVFLYTFSVAIVHRPDTFGIVLPPIYEIYPYYFYNTEVIHKAYEYKQKYYADKQYDGYKNFIFANYSGYYLNLHPEQSISYFTEDVGVNSFYYYYNIYYPFWLSGEEFGLKNDNRGELYYYVYQQLLARYYLERLSNDFGDYPYFNWELPFETGYYPSLQYPNGLEFPTRPNFAKLHEYFYNYGQKWSGKGKYGYSYTKVQEYERRIRDAIDSGFALGKDGKYYNLYEKDGFNTFGNLVEGNADSYNPRFYGQFQSFARHLLGYSYQPYDKYHVAPSALEHFETSLRDPAFYQLYKKVVLFFQKYKFNLPAYTEKDFAFPGVKVSKVEFDRLVTYFDKFDADITNAVFVTPEEFENDTFHVRVRQYRLNYKPFTYKIYVKSDKEYKASVRVFLGPKYDEYGRPINVNENRINFVEFDHFTHDLKSGENVITRDSQQFFFYQKDRTTYKQLYKHVLGALEGTEKFYLDGAEAYFGFPKRYLLPKGSYAGTEYQFYFFVTPYIPYEHQKNSDYYYPKPGTGKAFVDGYPLGFPFDRPFNEYYFLEAENFYSYDTKVYHRSAEDINASYNNEH